MRKRKIEKLELLRIAILTVRKFIQVVFNVTGTLLSLSLSSGGLLIFYIHSSKNYAIHIMFLVVFTISLLLTLQNWRWSCMWISKGLEVWSCDQEFPDNECWLQMQER